MHGVTIAEVIEKFKLKNMTPEIDAEKIVLTHPDVNRPALQLTGFFDHFDRERVQIIGYVEQAYINTMDREHKRQMYDKLTSSQIPCLVFSRDQEPDEDLLEYCNYYSVPCLVSDKTTSSLMAEIIRWLNVKLAPCISIHGVLIDVFGEGVLIMGESGIGKSEAALELIKRRHSDRLRSGHHQALYRAARHRDHRCENPVRRGEREGYPVHRHGDQTGGLEQGEGVRPPWLGGPVYGIFGQSGGVPYHPQPAGTESGDYRRVRSRELPSEKDGLQRSPGAVQESAG